ncbi:MAG: FmdB family zinc ribbon protein [Candidatus Omnitrophota bacterium]
MPTYEYECSHCGNQFEAFQRMTDKPLEECPKCHKKVKRLISSGSGVIFKGSGFYATDYRKGSSSGSSCSKSKDGCNSCPHKH